MGSARLTRPYPYLWARPGRVRCAGSPERIAAEAPTPVAVEHAAGALPGQGCRVADLRGPVCRPQVRRASAVRGGTSGAARTASRALWRVELPGTRAESWIAGAYPCEPRRQSPRCTLRNVLPGQRRCEWTAGYSGSASSTGQLGGRCHLISHSGPGQPGRAHYGRERPPWQLSIRAAGPLPGVPAGPVGPSARTHHLPWRNHPGQWPPCIPQVGDTDRRLPSFTGRTRRRARSRADVRSGRLGPARGTRDSDPTPPPLPTGSPRSRFREGVLVARLISAPVTDLTSPGAY